ncbi:MAG: GNAT family N-acetyltransferase [Eubacteriales bacterium]|nr:GNAT family N-acetyltransferase [Eubacteriales bacterium]
MQRIEYDCRDIDIYLELRKQVGWISLGRAQAKKALDNSLKIVTIYEDERPIAMGRIVGDGAVICYIQDLIVIPEYQSRHIGSQVIDILITYVKGITFKEQRMMLCLMCAKGRESFYEKHNFIARPTDELGPGMIQYIYKED